MALSWQNMAQTWGMMFWQCGPERYRRKIQGCYRSQTTAEGLRFYLRRFDGWEKIPWPTNYLLWGHVPRSTFPAPYSGPTDFHTWPQAPEVRRQVLSSIPPDGEYRVSQTPLGQSGFCILVQNMAEPTVTSCTCFYPCLFQLSRHRLGIYYKPSLLQEHSGS